MSLLSKVSSDQVDTHPFPHLVVENVLEDELCQRLIREYPPLETFSERAPILSNAKFNYPAVRALADPRLSDTWKGLIAEHVSPSFFGEMLRVFRPSLLHEYPDFEARFGKLETLRVGLRWRDNYDRYDVLLDAQINVHTPVLGPPSFERGPHVKVRNKPFVAFFYLRPDGDDSHGADHELFSIRPGVEPLFGPNQTTDPMCVRLERVIPYRRNTLVVLVNTPRSIQGLSMRTPSKVPVMYIDLVAQMNDNLFELRQAPPPTPMSRRRRLVRRVRGLLAGERA